MLPLVLCFNYRIHTLVVVVLVVFVLDLRFPATLTDVAAGDFSRVQPDCSRMSLFTHPVCDRFKNTNRVKSVDSSKYKESHSPTYRCFVCTSGLCGDFVKKTYGEVFMCQNPGCTDKDCVAFCNRDGCRLACALHVIDCAKAGDTQATEIKLAADKWFQTSLTRSQQNFVLKLGKESCVHELDVRHCQDDDWVVKGVSSSDSSLRLEVWSDIVEFVMQSDSHCVNCFPRKSVQSARSRSQTGRLCHCGVQPRTYSTWPRKPNQKYYRWSRKNLSTLATLCLQSTDRKATTLIRRMLPTSRVVVYNTLKETHVCGNSDFSSRCSFKDVTTSSMSSVLHRQR